MAQPLTSLDLHIQTLQFGHEALGVVFDYVAQAPAFARFESRTLLSAVLQQLRSGQNMCAHRDSELLGYCGWLLTDTESGERWLQAETGVPRLAAADADAALLTIVRADQPGVLRALLRRCRELYPHKTIFFKRVYGAGAHRDRRQSVSY